jgi:3-phenylpropionate/cinnamic acid dioxygenase small subunit
MTTETIRPASASVQQLAAVTEFLGLEAQLLDEGREEEWFELLDDDLLYEIPVRQATEPRSKELSAAAWRVHDTKAQIRIRISRLNTGHAYSEVPPSRTLRVVGSIRAEQTDDPDVLKVRSALLLYRQRGIDPYFHLIPARREDLIRYTPAGLRLLARKIILTETSLETSNLGVFL